MQDVTRGYFLVQASRVHLNLVSRPRNYFDLIKRFDSIKRIESIFYLANDYMSCLQRSTLVNVLQY